MFILAFYVDERLPILLCFISQNEILMTETQSDICSHYIPLPLSVTVEICQIT